MACNITAGISQDCSFAPSGLKALHLANFSEVSGVTADATGLITGITMSGSATFYTFEFSLDTASFSQELTVGTGDQKFINQQLIFDLPQLDQDKNNIYENIFLGRFAAIAEDNMGKAWLLGWTNPLRATAGNARIGAAPGDVNGYSVTLNNVQTQLAPEVDTSIIAGLL